MKRSEFWRFFLFLFVLIPACSCVEDAYVDCAHHEICKERNGFQRVLHCVDMLSDLDLQLLFEIIEDFYPGVKEREPLLVEICKDIPKAKKAFNHYYDERLKLNADMSPEGTKKMTEARVRKRTPSPKDLVAQIARKSSPGKPSDASRRHPDKQDEKG
ncbi:hypothetical protein TNIN_147641 [Trichonephila inaurata madagascariensis]|uniref:Uncharacterized protein n=1 Tax=Trichonephila inaurata madagascariensis TaxID=2747483 RepID=A0A8X6MIF7_9ARAC|nr:hypothetical protein TNIN_147641 [Trichonephila inaurata madagascariensis]